jgi:hypothetical protein
LAEGKLYDTRVILEASSRVAMSEHRHSLRLRRAVKAEGDTNAARNPSVAP